MIIALALRVLRFLMRSPLLARVATLQFRSPIARRAFSTVSGWLRSRDVTIPSGPGRGLRINLRGSALAFATGTAEQPVQDALSRSLRPGATLYDIGANVGFMTLVGARLVGPTGQVFAFDPVPENVEAIRSNVAMNGFDNVTVVEKAVSSGGGSGRLLVSGWSAFSRLETASVPADTQKALDVDLISVDQLVANGTPAPDVVKIDVEGAELDVIEGMRETIRQHRPTIVCEMHDRNREFVDLMSAHPYVVTNLDADVPVELGDRNAHTIAVPRDASSPLSSVDAG